MNFLKNICLKYCFYFFVDSGTKNEKKVDAGNRARLGISKFSTFFENADVDFETSQFQILQRNNSPLRQTKK